MLTQAFMLSLPGLPGIYIHSILGTQNDLAAVEKSGIKRRINRSKTDYDKLLEDLSGKGSLRNLVFTEYKKLLQIRHSYDWFDPFLRFETKTVDNRVIVIRKERGKKRFRAIFNFSDKVCNFHLLQNKKVKDLMTGNVVHSNEIILEPYAYHWCESV